jgi:hypothetical protein
MTIEIKTPVFDQEVPSRGFLNPFEGSGAICGRGCKVTASQVAECLALRLARQSEFSEEGTETLIGKQKAGVCASEALRKTAETGSIYCKCRGDLSRVLRCNQLAEILQDKRSPGVSDKMTEDQRGLGRAMGACSREILDQMPIDRDLDRLKEKKKKKKKT